MKSASRSLLGCLVCLCLLSSLVIAEPSKEEASTLISIPVPKDEDVQSFLSRLYPISEYFMGAGLMALQNVPVIGAFAHETGIFLILASAFGAGDQIAKITPTHESVPGLNHVGAAGVLFLAGASSFEEMRDPLSARNFAVLFTSAAAANQISGASKAIHSGDSPTMQSFKVILDNVIFTTALASAFGTNLAGKGYLPKLYNSLIISTAYGTKDFAQKSTAATGMTDKEALFYSGATMLAVASLLESSRVLLAHANLKNIVKQTVRDHLDGAAKAIVPFRDNLVEATFFTITGPVGDYLTAKAKEHFPDSPYTEYTSSVFDGMMAAGVSYLARSASQDQFILRNAAGGLRLRFVFFTLERVAKAVLPMGYTALRALEKTYREQATAGNINNEL